MASNERREEAKEAERRAALEELQRLRKEGDGLSSSLARAAQRASAHFLAKDATAEVNGAADPIEIWGRRIGRALSLAAFVALCIYLYATYLR
jgi:hypothetical protein